MLIQSAVDPNHQNPVANCQNGQHTTLSAWTRNDSRISMKLRCQPCLNDPRPAQFMRDQHAFDLPSRMQRLDGAKTLWRQMRSAVPQPAICVQIVHLSLYAITIELLTRVLEMLFHHCSCQESGRQPWNARIEKDSKKNEGIPVSTCIPIPPPYFPHVLLVRCDVPANACCCK